MKLEILNSSALWKKGLVTIIDALGASYWDRLQIDKFLAVRSYIIKNYTGAFKDIGDKFGIPPPGCYTIGDTMVFTTEIPKQDKRKIQLYCQAVATCTRRLLAIGIDNQIHFRGAIGEGEYLEDKTNNTVLGPAVADAASWHEQSEWTGIHCTPKLSIRVDEIAGWNDKRVAHLSDYLIEYPVPVKGGDMKLRAVNWPWFYNKYLMKSHGTNRSRLLNTISQCSIPKGTEQKYFNTIRFYDTCTQANAGMI